MNLNDLASDLQSVFQDWAPYVINLRGKRMGNLLSWPDRRIVKSNKPVTRGEVLMMDMEGQYSMQIEKDEALIRLYYVFDSSKQKLLGASLGYYSTLPALVTEGTLEGQFMGASDEELSPDDEESVGITPEPEANADSLRAVAPETLAEGDSPEAIPEEFAGILPEEVESGIDSGDDLGGASGMVPPVLEEEVEQTAASQVLSDDSVVSWIRIDFDPGAKTKGVLHHDCHLHVAGFPHMRVPINAVPSPRQFVDFVMAVCYPETYKQHRLASAHSFSDPNHYGRIGNSCLMLDSFEWLGGVTSLLVPMGGADARVRAAAARRAEEEKKKAAKNRKRRR